MRKALLVILILLIGGIVAADRIGVRVAQDEIGKQVAAQYDLGKRPDVTIHGFPFLTQAIGGDYDRIELALGDWTQQGVTVRDVKVEMRGVRAPLSDVVSGNSSQFGVRTATASAVVPYSVLKKQAPEQVQGLSARGSDLRIDLAGSLVGIPLRGTAVVSVKPTARGIAVTPVSIGSGGGGSLVPIQVLQRQLTWTVPLRNLPVGSRISKIEVAPQGLRIAATAQNIQLNNLPKA